MTHGIRPRGRVELSGAHRQWQRPLAVTLSQLRRRLRSLLLALLGVLGGCVIFDRLVMPRVTKLGQEVVVPNVVGLPIDEAESKLHAAKLAPAKGPAHYSDDIPRGQVLGSSPIEGMRVKRGREVYLSQSLGTLDKRVPDFTGFTVRMARVEMQELGLQLGTVSYAAVGNDDEAILATSPAPGSAFPPSGSVSVLLTKQKKPTPYWMPDLRGYAAAMAVDWLKKGGFAPEFAPGSAPGYASTVTWQVPQPGGMVWPGGKVVLSIDDSDPWHGGEEERRDP